MDARNTRGDGRKVRPTASALAAAVLLSVLPGAAWAAERVAGYPAACDCHAPRRCICCRGGPPMQAAPASLRSDW